ncbi:metal ABC transporter permease [Desulfobulbus rhabdoformis]|uniref:metal ABC transporter permease n=1 Tax=Desulfobulbus rhabdoformis TaxID=34032 RepID=UPI001965DA8A|nr:metal ABC transporter permease [Desulfobulbus rhabdoformis]MBM9612814.1 metal ABC transporter permease [Desulfobulbus rhabdoformis]
MNTFVDICLSPFQEFLFMRHALVACFALALGCGPVGMLLVLRRMSLMGDALSHAVLPGAAIGFLVSGLSLYSMTIGGIVVGLLVALIAGLVSRYTSLREDASFAALYLVSIAVGVLIISLRGTNVDLIHVLFGTILAVDDPALILVASITSLTLFTLAFIYRPLLVECFDPDYLKSVGGHGGAMHSLFLVLVVLNLVAGFTALGTLMAVGMLMLPAASAHFWGNQYWTTSLVAVCIAMFSGYCGLLLSYHFNLPTGPSIILVAGGCYLFSLVFGRKGSLLSRYQPGSHLTG